MKLLILTSSLISLMFVGCNTQTKRSECYTLISLNNLHSLPTEAAWKAAAEGKNQTSESKPNCLVYSVNDLHSLPTEAEWKAAAEGNKTASESNLNKPVYCGHNSHTLPTEAEWKKAAASGNRLNAK